MYILCTPNPPTDRLTDPSIHSYPFICPSICPPIQPSIDQFIYPPIHHSIHIFINPFIQSIHSSMYPCTQNLSIHPSIHQSPSFHPFNKMTSNRSKINQPILFLQQYCSHRAVTMHGEYKILNCLPNDKTLTYLYLNPLPNKPLFLLVCSTSLLKTL